VILAIVTDIHIFQSSTRSCCTCPTWNQNQLCRRYVYFWRTRIPPLAQVDPQARSFSTAIESITNIERRNPKALSHKSGRGLRQRHSKSGKFESIARRQHVTELYNSKTYSYVDVVSLQHYIRLLLLYVAYASLSVVCACVCVCVFFQRCRYRS
jgi:hypothetical protein